MQVTMLLDKDYCDLATGVTVHVWVLWGGRGGGGGGLRASFVHSPPFSPLALQHGGGLHDQFTIIVSFIHKRWA